MAKTRLYTSADAHAFRDLNRAWIEKYFGIEPEDIAQLDDVEGTILSKGGRIVLAEHDGVVCGTGALIPLDAELVEFAKMAVREDLQGLGLGKAVMARSIEEARDMGAKALWIESNTILETAIGLYMAFGFEELD